ncbi:MAG TPA: NADH-quinone oxidoreductase subunit M [Flavitalea sp.]|nr:NADH-quinone oxidoreductase subunit M [Flavitalea sp.]
MILVWMISVFFITGLACWAVQFINRSLCRWVALTGAVVNLILSHYLFLSYRNSASGIGNWLIDFKLNWIPYFGITFHLSLDGLSLVMLLLTTFLGVLSVLCSWTEIKERTGFYYFNLLWTLAGITGVFVAMDMFLFYFFWEIMIVPMYFLIAIWGDTNRRYASYKFFIFTQAGGLLMLLSILALYFTNGAQTGTYTYDYFTLKNAVLSFSAGRWIMLGFLIAFIIKLPAVPFHSWLPDAHSEAPTAGSLILAGLLLKTGAYGIIRFVVTMFPQNAAEISQLAMLMGVIGIIYGAMLAFAQTDLKRFIAYTSVSHMGFILLGVFAFREMALQGVVMQMLTHGISTGALFAMAGMIKERLHTRDINSMGGLWTGMPVMGGLALLFAMASLGLPMMGNFVAEFLILLSAYQVSPVLTIIASVGLVFAALYSLRMIQKVFMGPNQSASHTQDLNAREFAILISLSVAIVLLGLFPQPVLDSVKEVVQLIHKNSPV